MSEKSIFNVTVAGQYYANIDGRKTFLPYKEVFKLNSLDSALSIIKNKLLFDRLHKTCKNFTGFRTHEIVGVTSSGAQREPDKGVLNLPIEQLHMQQLQDFCLLRGFPIDPSTAGTIDDARALVLAANLDWASDQQRVAAAKAELDKENELRALNDLAPKRGGSSDLAHTPTPPDSVKSESAIISDKNEAADLNTKLVGDLDPLPGVNTEPPPDGGPADTLPPFEQDPQTESIGDL